MKTTFLTAIRYTQLNQQQKCTKYKLVMIYFVSFKNNGSFSYKKKQKKKKKKKKRALALIRNDVCMNNFNQAYKAAVEYNQISTIKRELDAAFLHSCNIANILPLKQKTIGTVSSHYLKFFEVRMFCFRYQKFDIL